MTKAVFFDIDDTIYDYIGAHNNTMSVMKEWAYENLGIAKEDLEKYVAEARVKADDRAGRDYAVNHKSPGEISVYAGDTWKASFPICV